mgnify:FL=1
MNIRLKKEENQGVASTLVIDSHLKHHVGGEIEDHPAMWTKIDALPMLAVNDDLRRQFHVAIVANRVFNAGDGTGAFLGK